MVVSCILPDLEVAVHTPTRIFPPHRSLTTDVAVNWGNDFRFPDTRVTLVSPL